jgi:hypothetical protein
MIRDHVERRRVEAASVTTRQVVPVAFTMEGYTEEIAIAGNMLLVFQVTGAESGKTHVEIAVSPMELAATSLTSGTPYHVLVTPASTFEVGGLPPLEFTFAFSMRLMGRGPENDLLLYDVLRVTVSSDYKVVAVPKQGFCVLRRSADQDSRHLLSPPARSELGLASGSQELVGRH